MQEFNEMMSPFQKEYKVLLNCRIDKGAIINLDIEKLFTMETRRLMRNVLTNLLEAVKLKLDIKKANVMSENELLNVFDLADSKKDGILDFEEIKNFAAAQKVLFTKKETDILINILDHDQDGIVNQNDFVNAFIC